MAKAATKLSEDEILKRAMERVRAEEGGDDEAVEGASTKPKTGPKGKVKVTAPPEATSDTVPKSKKSAQIAYVPLDREDPSFTIFFGMKFSANLPREVTNQECIALAKTNPWFTVDGKKGPKRVKAQPRSDEDREQEARSGSPDGLDPEKHEVEAEAEDFAE